MQISPESRNVIGWLLITVPVVIYGGVFVLSILRGATQRTEKQMAYNRAGHAHAGVLVILAIIAQVLIDTVALDPTVRGALRAGFFLPPILVSAGFFLGAPSATDTRPGRLLVLVYIGALILAVSALVLGVSMVTA